MKRSYLLIAVLLLIFASSAYAANYPAVEYGRYNILSEARYPQAIEDYFNQNLKQYDMPTFTRPGWSTIERTYGDPASAAEAKIGRVTSHEDMLAYIEALPRTNMQLRYVSEIYTYDNENSPPGAGIPMKSFPFALLVFTKEAVFDPADVKALGRPIVLLEAAIHGNEISGKEAMLALAKRLATPGMDLNALLDRVSVVMIPRYTVDGAFKFQRGTDSIRQRYYNSVNDLNNNVVTEGGARGLDQNRDNTGFESPIVRIVHMIWDAYEPHFIADAHQMGDTVGTATWDKFDIATLFTSNPNSPEELDILAHDGITIKADPNNPTTWATSDSLENLAKKALRAEGLEWWNYIGTGYTSTEPHVTGPNPFEYHNGTEWVAKGANQNYILAHSGYQEGNPEEGITDSVARIKGAFGLLAEGRTPGGNSNTGTSGNGIATTNYNRRIQAHEIVYAEMVKAFADPVTGPILKDAVERSRVAMATGTAVRTGVATGDLVVALQNPPPVSAEIEIPGEKGVPVLRLVRNPNDPSSDIPVVSEDYLPIRISRSRRVVALPESDRPFSTVQRPTAYIITADEAAVARIAMTGVRIERLAEPATVPVEYYTVTEFGSNVNFRGAYNVTVSQLPVGISAVIKRGKTMTFPKDTYVFFMDQYNSVHASLTVEPSAGRNFGNYWVGRAGASKNGFLPVAIGQDYPAYRYMGDASELETYFAGDITMLPFVSGTHIEWPTLMTQEEKDSYVSGVLTDSAELVFFSSYKVNALAVGFDAYLKKTGRDNVTWYVWNHVNNRAERLTPNSIGYATITADCIGTENDVVMFCTAPIDPGMDPVLPPDPDPFTPPNPGPVPDPDPDPIPGPGPIPGSGGGCNAGYAAFGILMLVPFFGRKRS